MQAAYRSCLSGEYRSRTDDLLTASQKKISSNQFQISWRKDTNFVYICN